MNLVETGDLLTIIQNLSGRTTAADDAMVIVWQQILADLDYADAVQAVAAHFRETTEYLLPGHIVAGVRAIRNARAAAVPSEPLALPSRFEPDDIRDERIKRHLPELMAKWSMTANDPGDPHAAAVTRAKADRRADAVARRKRGEPPRPAQLPRPRREPGKPVDLDKVTTGPDWANAENREREAVLALHRAGHPCGKRACARETCRPATVDAP